MVSTIIIHISSFSKDSFSVNMSYNVYTHKHWHWLQWDIYTCNGESSAGKHSIFSFQQNPNSFCEDERDDPWQRMWDSQRISWKFLYEYTCQGINSSCFWWNSPMQIVLKLHNYLKWVYIYFQKQREKQSGDNIHFHANKTLTCKTELQ